jgi:hypothetical protein
MTRGARGDLDVYLLPAVVGGGLGDIEEVLGAGRRLAAAGFACRLPVGPGRPLPRSVDGPWGWPALARSDRIVPHADRALTVSAWWGVSAAPAREEPYGRPGPWADAAGAIDRTYGPGRVLHVSFEEFARTLTSRAQTAERWREGGVPLREIRRRGARGGAARDVAAFRRAYARFRAFDRPDVLHLYPTFVFARAFRREFPEAVQCGPLWPEPVRPRPARASERWIWYASPGSSGRLAARLAAGWAPTPRGRPRSIELRSPRPFDRPSVPGLAWVELAPRSRAAWRRRWASAGVRIATGSRTLLEALVDGGPFLYFNGVSGSGRATRRHRPEKIDALLRLWARRGVDRRLRRDLASFSRLRSVARIVRRARSDPGWTARFPRPVRPWGFRPGYEDAGRLLETVARAFASGRGSAAELVAEIRAGAGPAPRSEDARSSQLVYRSNRISAR